MLDFTQQPDEPDLRLLVLHDDADREFSYTSGAEESLAKADTSGWTIISMRTDLGTNLLTQTAGGSSTCSCGPS